MTTEEAIVQALLERAALIPDVEATFAVEPGQIETETQLPCVAVKYRGFTQEPVDIVPRYEFRWRWRVYVYVPYGDYEQPQLQLKRILAELLRIARDDRRLGNTCLEWELAIDDDADAPETNREEGWMLHTLTMVAVTNLP